MNLHGIFPPIATPFKDDEVDLDAMRSNVTKWMKTGLAGVLVLGSNGEAPMLDADESYRVACAAREAVPKEKTLIVGAGEESTRSTIAAVRRAADAGADVVLVRTPCYFKNQMTTDLFVRHFTAVADASPVPVLPYNVPGLTGVKMAAEAVAKLAPHPNIPGVKDSSADLTQIADLVAMTPAGFNVMVGSAPTLYASLCVGAVAGIVAAACVVPDLVVQLYDLTRAGTARRGGGAAAEDHAAGEVGDVDVRRGRSQGGDGTGRVRGRSAAPAAAARDAADLRDPAQPVRRAGDCRCRAYGCRLVAWGDAQGVDLRQDRLRPAEVSASCIDVPSSRARLPSPSRPGRRQRPAASVRATQADQAVPKDLKPLLLPRQSEMRLVTARYTLDRATLSGNYFGGSSRGGGRGAGGPGGAARAARRFSPSRSRPHRIARLKRFDLDWQAALAALDSGDALAGREGGTGDAEGHGPVEPETGRGRDRSRSRRSRRSSRSPRPSSTSSRRASGSRTSTRRRRRARSPR